MSSISIRSTKSSYPEPCGASNTFTSAVKGLDPLPQFRAGEVGEVPWSGAGGVITESSLHKQRVNPGSAPGPALRLSGRSPRERVVPKYSLLRTCYWK